MFEVKQGTAYYNGEIDAAEIALAVLTAKQAAREQDITRFVCRVPNSACNTISEVTRLVACKGVIEQDGSDGVLLTYRFTRVVTVEIVGARTLSQTPPDTLDLAHRIMTAPTANGQESL